MCIDSSIATDRRNSYRHDSTLGRTRSNRTRTEGWHFGRRQASSGRGRRSSKEGPRPRGATVGDATFGQCAEGLAPGELVETSVDEGLEGLGRLRPSSWRRRADKRSEAKALTASLTGRSLWGGQDEGARDANKTRNGPKARASTEASKARATER